jgi:hypothetical protein
MFLAAGIGGLRSGTARRLLAAVLALEAVAIVSIAAQVRASRRVNEQRMTFNQRPGVWWLKNVAAPTVLPPIKKANEATIRPDEVVIGVELGGRARAYRLAAFDDASGHLVNDLLGGLPLSVAYCNITSTARVYTDPKGTAVLDAEILGLLDKEIVIRLGGHLYFHSSGKPVEPDKGPPPMPFRLLTPTLTTWQDWAKHHPATDVFVGGRGND